MRADVMRDYEEISGHGGWALGVKRTFTLLGASGIATIWEAVLADVHVAPVATLNSTRILRQNCAGRARGDR